MSTHQPDTGRDASDADVQEAMDDAPINPLTGIAEPEYHLVRDDREASEVADRAGREDPPADDLDDAPINPQTGEPEPMLIYIGEDDATAG
jgi:hypothetical protein